MYLIDLQIKLILIYFVPCTIIFIRYTVLSVWDLDIIVLHMLPHLGDWVVIVAMIGKHGKQLLCVRVFYTEVHISYVVPFRFHDFLNIDSEEAQMIKDTDKLYSKGSRLASEVSCLLLCIIEYESISYAYSNIDTPSSVYHK